MAGLVTIYPSKTAGWVGTQVHLVERKTLLPHPSSRFFYHPASGWSRDLPQPGSLFERPREAEKRDPGNEVGLTPDDYSSMGNPLALKGLLSQTLGGPDVPMVCGFIRRELVSKSRDGASCKKSTRKSRAIKQNEILIVKIIPQVSANL